MHSIEGLVGFEVASQSKTVLFSWKLQTVLQSCALVQPRTVPYVLNQNKVAFWAILSRHIKRGTTVDIRDSKAKREKLHSLKISQATADDCAMDMLKLMRLVFVVL